MLTPKQAALLMLVDPTFKPGPVVLGSMRVAGFTDENDALLPDRRAALADEVRQVIRRVDDQFYVKYYIGGASHWAGPYAENEVESHRADIVGYEGVSDVTIERHVRR